MRLKCVVCHRDFYSKARPKELDGFPCDTATMFCNYLLPTSSVNLSGPLEFCSSCQIVYLTPVHERHTKTVSLKAGMKQNVSRLKRLFLQNQAVLLSRPTVVNELKILASMPPTEPLISAETFLGDSTVVEDSTANAIDEAHEERTPVRPVMPLGNVKKSTREDPSYPSPSAATTLENTRNNIWAGSTIEPQIVAQQYASSVTAKQTDKANVSKALSSLPSSEPPVDCLTYHGIPYAQLPNGDGYKCCACEKVQIRRTLNAAKHHIRRIHLGKKTSKEKSYVMEDKKTQRIRCMGKYTCHKLPDGSFKCGSCDYKTKGNISAILAHVRMKHEGAAGTLFRRLIEVSPNKFEYYGLTAERRNDGSFLCGSCPFTTKALKYLRFHLREKLTKGIQRICEICGQVFYSDQRLYNHRRTHPTGSEQKCGKCGKSFDTKSKLFTHRSKMHRRHPNPKKPPNPSKIYVCEFCGKKYKAKYGFDTHMNVHHSTNPKTFECKVCGKSYASEVARYVHMNSHTGKKDHSCDVCGMKFTQAYSVVRHKNVAHKES